MVRNLQRTYVLSAKLDGISGLFVNKTEKNQNYILVVMLQKDKILVILYLI